MSSPIDASVYRRHPRPRKDAASHDPANALPSSTVSSASSSSVSPASSSSVSSAPSSSVSPASSSSVSSASSAAFLSSSVGILAAGRECVVSLHLADSRRSARAAPLGFLFESGGGKRDARSLSYVRVLSSAASLVSHSLSSLLGYSRQGNSPLASQPRRHAREASRETTNRLREAGGSSPLNSPQTDRRTSESEEETAEEAPALPAKIVDDSKRVGLSLAVCPWNNSLAALTDSCGKISLINTSSLEILFMWKGYREAQVAWLRCFCSLPHDSNPCSSPPLSREGARPGDPHGGLVLYAPRRDLVELWELAPVEEAWSVPQRVGVLLWSRFSFFRSFSSLHLDAHAGNVLLVDATGRVAALGWPDFHCLGQTSLSFLSRRTQRDAREKATFASDAQRELRSM
ncbi:putative Rab3 GTPase-activating non-catalytic subunit [Toxoplasma gondii TgCatPRC2]|uniref:Putative Rab3 GTPase-activating non-catalytic subunit n=1 Tax=Toxoplasma gondii TgCatPRC2 TaxID=1130821 RepID=A0A151HM25_TOXGO|nr:putative Rab3 GTPase-activating non-catalytic subunit [Toxoplasma gondii TgCatPRC2]